jgi:periplasmic divalent cation tolerance protein
MEPAMPSKKKDDLLVVFITTPVGDVGQTIARALVAARLAACVTILPAVKSCYTWQDELCEESEELLVVKTRAALFERLRIQVRVLHPYDVPEIIALPIKRGDAAYLKWVRTNTASKFARR